MENKFTEMLDVIIQKEADEFTKEGLVFGGFSIPMEISKRNDCFKGWSQSFSMERATNNTEDLSSFMEMLNSIKSKILIDIYRNNFQMNATLENSVEALKNISLISVTQEQYLLTDKGICFLTAFLSLRNILKKN